MDSDARYYSPSLNVRHVAANTWEQITLDGAHIRYLVAEPVEIESTLEAQAAASRRRSAQ